MEVIAEALVDTLPVSVQPFHSFSLNIWNVILHGRKALRIEKHHESALKHLRHIEHSPVAVSLLALSRRKQSRLGVFVRQIEKNRA